MSDYPPDGYQPMTNAMEVWRNLPDDVIFYNQEQDPCIQALYIWQLETEEYRQKVMSDPLLKYEQSRKRQDQRERYSSFFCCKKQ